MILPWEKNNMQNLVYRRNNRLKKSNYKSWGIIVKFNGEKIVTQSLSGNDSYRLKIDHCMIVSSVIRDIRIERKIIFSIIDRKN